MYALDGIRVVDLSTMIAGPFCTMLLADMGADVIKVEPPDGDPWRQMGLAFLGANRGKRSIAVDVRKDEGGEIFRKLISTSDILVENFRPGIWQKLGLDYQSLCRIKPDLIYISIPAFGSTGPYVMLPGYDGLPQVLSGQSVSQGGIGNPPVFLKRPSNDYAAAMLSAYGAMLALYVRAKQGKGQYVETSIIDAAVAMQASDFIDYPGMQRQFHGDADLKGVKATCRLYKAQDGRWFFVLCTNEAQCRALAQVLGRDDLLNDPRFHTPQKREENDAALVDILANAFSAKPAQQWLALLEEAAVPCAPSLTVDEILKDPHYLANELVVDHDHPVLGRVRQTGIGPKLSQTPGRIWRPAPVVGQHTNEILIELGYSEEQIADLRAKRIIA